MKKIHYLMLFLSVSGLYACHKSSKSNDPIPKSSKSNNPVPKPQVNVNDPIPKPQVNVYVAGTEGPVAKYWKNGNPVNLTNGPIYSYGTIDAEATSLYVSGNDVYLAGGEHGRVTLSGNSSYISIAKYWKNGNPVNLNDNTIRAGATSIFVSGNDVYVAGWVLRRNSNGPVDIARYWKNGNPVDLTDGTAFASANSIFVSTQ